MCREKEKGTVCREIESACKDSERECVCVCVCVCGCRIEIGSV